MIFRQTFVLFAREPQFAREARGRFAFGDAAQEQHQRGGRLSDFLERRAGQQGVGAIVVTTAIVRNVLLLAEEASLCAPAMQADETVGWRWSSSQIIHMHASSSSVIGKSIILP